MIFGSYAMYIPVLLERIARGIMDKVSIKNDLELINSKFGTSYTASDYMYGKGHIKQIVTYISISTTTSLSTRFRFWTANAYGKRKTIGK